MAEKKEETKKEAKKATGYVATGKFNDAVYKGVKYEKGDKIKEPMSDQVRDARLASGHIKEA